MSNSKKPVNTNPFCCGERSTWVDIGRYLQYFYCKICKKEVKEDKPYSGSGEIALDQDPMYMWGHGVSSIKATPLLSNETARITSTTPCVGSIHHWSDRSQYHVGLPCNCGDRYNASGIPASGFGP